MIKMSLLLHGLHQAYWFIRISPNDVYEALSNDFEDVSVVRRRLSEQKRIHPRRLMPFTAGGDIFTFHLNSLLGEGFAVSEDRVFAPDMLATMRPELREYVQEYHLENPHYKRSPYGLRKRIEEPRTSMIPSLVLRPA